MIIVKRAGCGSELVGDGENISFISRVEKSLSLELLGIPGYLRNACNGRVTGRKG